MIYFQFISCVRFEEIYYKMLKKERFLDVDRWLSARQLVLFWLSRANGKPKFRTLDVNSQRGDLHEGL